MSLAGLSKQEKARMGNYYGKAGMVVALLATILARTLKVSHGFYWLW